MTPRNCVHGVIDGRRLRQQGHSKEAIRHLVRTGRLRRLHRDVYVLGDVQLTQRGRSLAAVLACGDGAVLSHLSAAVVWNLRDLWPLRPQVTVPNATGAKGPTGIELHHSTTLGPPAHRDRIPLTTLPRTLEDVAPRLQPAALKAAVRQAERLHHLDLNALHASTHTKALRHLLNHYVTGSGLTQDELEPLFFELCANHDIPLPETQVPFGRYFADFVWHDVRLIVETDGRGTHDGYVAYREDRVRDRALKRFGYEVLRFVYAEVLHEAAAVAAEVKEARARVRR